MPASLLLTLSVMVATAHALTIHVPDDYPGIQIAIEASQQGDSIIVRPGLFVENINLMGKAVKLVSEEGPGNTIIEPASGTSAIVTFNSGEDSNTVVDGFTIRNNSGNRGVAFNNSGGVVQNCEIQNCSYSFLGGGITCSNSNAKIRNNRIHDNSVTDSGAGIGITGNPTDRLEITGNEIYENETGTHGPGIACLNGSNILIAFNVLYENLGSSQNSGAVYIWGNNAQILNNTIVNNSRGINMVPTSGPLCHIYNNIVVGNQIYGISPGTTAIVDYNDDWNNGSNGTAGPNGFSSDPQFLNLAERDFHLNPTSPCINAGHPDLVYNDPDGTRNDLGAHPLADLNYPVAINFSPDPGSVNGVVMVANPLFSWEYLDTTLSSQSAFEIEVGTDNDWDVCEMWHTGVIQSGVNSIIYAGVPLEDHVRYCIRIRLSNGSGAGSWQQSMMVTRYTSTVRVPTDFATIADGIFAAVEGDTIRVSAGMYTGTGNRDLDFDGKNVVIIGAGSDSTIIDCQGTATELHRAFWLHSDEDTSTVIRDLKIINGTHIAGGGIYCANSGLRLVGVTFQSNKGTGDFSGGGAVAVTGKRVIFENCQFLSNTAEDFGGGVYAYGSDLKFEKCSFKYNFQSSNMGCVDFETGGGGVYARAAKLSFDECTFERNLSICGVYDIDAVNGCSLYVSNSTFIGRRSAERSLWGAGDVKVYYSSVGLIENCLFIRNDGYPVGGFGAKLVLNNCTIADCYGGIYDGFVDMAINNCVIANIGPGEAVYVEAVEYNEPPVITCTDIWGNSEGDWAEPIDSQFALNGNVSRNPFFCAPALGDYRVAEESICLPSNNSCGLLIGIGEAGCNALFACGDVDASNTVNVSDVVYLINYIFSGGPAPYPPDSGEVDCNGSVTISDAVYLISYIFSGGPAPCAACP